jgi:hypothetical protein
VLFLIDRHTLITMSASHFHPPDHRIGVPDSPKMRQHFR